MKGFTLIEVLVVIVISLTITGMILVNYNSYNNTQVLKQAALTLKNNIRFAQTKAITGDKPPSCTELLGYTVAFFNVPNNVSKYTIQAECDSGLLGGITTITLPAGVVFSPQPPNFRFNVLSLGTTLNTDLAIQLAGSGKQYRIQVSPGGDISDLGLQ